MVFRQVPALRTGTFIAALTLAACATSGPGIRPAEITLTGSQMEAVDLDGQSLRLEFSARNPNPFPLPINSIRYELTVGDRKVARGETRGDFVVPARGEGAFAIGVELDVLDSVSQIGFLLLKEQVEYEFHGVLAVDLPFARPMPFAGSGYVRLRSGGGAR